MGLCCIFFTEGRSPTCRLFCALGLGELNADDRAVLQQQYCTKDRFVECPLFQQAERGLANKHLRLGSRHAAGVEASISAQPGPDNVFGQ
jgi:hypothetical protein